MSDLHLEPGHLDPAASAADAVLGAPPPPVPDPLAECRRLLRRIAELAASRPGDRAGPTTDRRDP